MLNVKETIFFTNQLRDASVYSLVQLRSQLRSLAFGSKPDAVEFVVIGSPARIRNGSGLIIPTSSMSDSEVLMACVINASHAQFNGNRSSDRYSLEELNALQSPTRKAPDEAYKEAFRRSLKTTGYCESRILWVNLNHQEWNWFRFTLGGVNLAASETRRMAMGVLEYVAQRLQ